MNKVSLETYSKSIKIYMNECESMEGGKNEKRRDVQAKKTEMVMGENC